ncbi:MAG: GDSL family lipase [Rhodospirillaceae bacterium]|jgi:acyl-CoA thioesterase I|nr:GDSL family lipase [Rhodospirillaceae bacterium]MBT5665126.1 GDSL family lipase [Rhodospirillaceae bacterium]
MVQIRIGFIGDSITHGTGDETLLGWPYRVGQAEVARGHDITVYNLGIRADTSELVAERWEAECEARLRSGVPGATIFAIGINDSAHEKSATKDGQRVELDRSLDIIGDMLTSARTFGPVLWVGPTPVIEDMMPLARLPGVVYDFRNDVISDYNQAYITKAAELATPYLDLFTPLGADPAWEAALRKSDGLHPNSDGYVLMTEHIGAWAGWRALFDG